MTLVNRRYGLWLGGLMIDNPHFSFPFRLNAAGTAAAVVEQDSMDEVTDCVEVLLRTPLGSRPELPDYGIADQTFRQGGADIEALKAAILLWEERADAIIERDPGALTDLTDRLRIKVAGRDLNA